MSNTNVPEGLRYSKEHEWARQEGAIIVVGITDYAQHELHDIVYVELPALGRKVVQMEKLCVLETMKAVADVFSPVGGEVAEMNGKLKQNPELVNKDPYGNGWMVKLKPLIPTKAKEELGRLMDSSAYRAFIEAAKTH